ncbi:hypothetical protein ACK316_08465 [Aeromonas caviae]
MGFNFEDFLNKGSEAADQVINNKKEINEVIKEMIISLTQFLEMGLQLIEETEFEDNDDNERVPMAHAAFLSYRDLKKRQATGYTHISIASENDKIKETCYLFKLKRSPDGYPITVVKGDIHMVSENQNEFASAIGEVLSDAQTHIKLKSFVRKIKAILEK